MNIQWENVVQKNLKPCHFGWCKCALYTRDLGLVVQQGDVLGSVVMLDWQRKPLWALSSRFQNWSTGFSETCSITTGHECKRQFWSFSSQDAAVNTFLIRFKPDRREVVWCLSSLWKSQVSNKPSGEKWFTFTLSFSIQTLAAEISSPLTVYLFDLITNSCRYVCVLSDFVYMRAMWVKFTSGVRKAVKF